MSTLSERLTTAAASLWRTLGLNKTPLKRVADYFAHLPIPWGLTSEWGILYGWTLHEKLHNHEPETVAFFKKHLKKGDIIADVGASIGYYSLLFSELVGSEGRVFAFEPDPLSFSRLARATQRKTNICLRQVGLLDHEEIVKLYGRRKGDTFNSMAYEPGKTVSVVPVIPLRSEPVTFQWAKIDVEGSELKVLAGMKERIPCVMEVAKGIQGTYGGGVGTFLDAIRALGYKVRYITPEGDAEDRDILEEIAKGTVKNVYLEPV